VRWILFLMSGAIALSLWLPGQAAQPGPPAAMAPAPTGDGDGKITFAQYRDWRNAYNERRRSELAMQLATAAAAAHLPPGQRTRLEQVKAYYDWLAGLSESERDRRYRERFDLIDANHDGTIDAAERAAWRDKQRTFYRRAASDARAGGTQRASPDKTAEPAASAAAVASTP
jgi:hypothetical protein